MDYKCIPCGFSTGDSGNWARHKKTGKHIKLTKTNIKPECIQNTAENSRNDKYGGDYGCKYCVL